MTKKSNIQQELNIQYSELCRQLGDLITQREKISEHITSIKQRIEALNTAQPIVISLEAKQKGANNE